jgi:drug/metabolite transporter (DMT)-like permease
MANFLFYSMTVLIWGSTWLAIKFQLGVVPPSVSITYRFALAALLLFFWCLVTRRSLRFRRNDQLFMMLQGSLLFALNYLFFYLAELELTSGLAAVVFSTIVIMNLINGRLFLGTPMEWKVLLGSVLGLFGLLLMFWPEVARFDAAGDALLALGYCFLATYLASLGNIVSARNQQNGLPIIQTNAYGMAYGALLMLMIAQLFGSPLIIETTFSYLGSLFYLALFGSVIAFGCYLSLVGRIGPGRAAYATLLFPLVALLLSTIWEDYRWTTPAVVGMAMILGGNYLAMVKRKSRATRESLQEVASQA